MTADAQPPHADPDVQGPSPGAQSHRRDSRDRRDRGTCLPGTGHVWRPAARRDKAIGAETGGFTVIAAALPFLLLWFVLPLTASSSARP
jgi:hypothetical protein